MSNSNDLVMLLFSTCRFLKESMRKSLPVNSSMGQFEALRYIVLHKNTTMKQLADYLLVSPPAATLIVGALVDESLVERLVSAKDRRIVRLALTKKGEKFVEQARKKASTTLKKIVAGLNSREQDQLQTILKKIIKTK